MRIRVNENHAIRSVMSTGASPGQPRAGGQFGRYKFLDLIHLPTPSNPLATRFIATVSAPHCAAVFFGPAEALPYYKATCEISSALTLPSGFVSLRT
jgi:hypothetical protein